MQVNDAGQISFCFLTVPRRSGLVQKVYQISTLPFKYDDVFFDAKIICSETRKETLSLHKIIYVKYQFSRRLQRQIRIRYLAIGSIP